MEKRYSIEEVFEMLGEENLKGSALKASIENGSEYHGRKWYIVSDSD